MLRGITFTIPAPATDPTGDAVIKAFPDVTQKKIPMRCQFNPALNQWECDVPKWYEQREVLYGIGGGFVALFLGIWLGRRQRG